MTRRRPTQPSIATLREHRKALTGAVAELRPRTEAWHRQMADLQLTTHALLAAEVAAAGKSRKRRRAPPTPANDAGPDLFRTARTP